MEGGISVHSDSEACRGGGVVLGAGQKTMRGKVVKGDSVSLGVGVGVEGTQKKMLADVTNLQQQQQQQQRCAKPINQPEIQQFVPVGEADISTVQLLKENATLIKLVANRNLIIESCKAELEKSHSNFEKLRKQNAELALTNSQMLAELNSSRQRLRELQLELGSKNGILKAMKLELTAKEHAENLMPESIGNEVGAAQSKQPTQSLQEDSKVDNLGHAKRRRVSKCQSAAPAVVNQVTSKEKVENRRYSLRRESVKLKAEKPGPAEDNFAEEIKFDALHPQETMANEIGPTSLESNVHQEQVREDTSSSGPTKSEQVNAKRNTEKKRQSMRRQSARFKPLNPEPTEDSFEVDDGKFSVSHLCDMSDESAPKTSRETSPQVKKETNDPWETRRSSVGRPMRQTAGKVVSYKEVPLNKKMRRPN